MSFARRGLLRGVGDLAGRAGRSFGLGAAGAAGDEFFDNVVLLLDFAGDDGATGVVDLSDSAHGPFTFVNGAEVDTAVQYIDENTLKLRSGFTDTIHVPDSADWDFGTGDFTIEFGVLFNPVSSSRTLVSVYEAATDGFYVQYADAGETINVGTAASGATDFAWLPVVDTWYHVAVCRIGTNLRVFVDGVQKGITETNSIDFTGSAVPLVIGGLQPTNQTLAGAMGAVRITKGVGRYAANFDPPTEFYPFDAPTDADFASVTLLLDMAGDDNATVLTDLSPLENVVTFVTGALLATEQSKFGGTSLHIPDTGEITMPNTGNRFNNANADFTVELHYRADTTAGGDSVIGMNKSGARTWELLCSNNSLNLQYTEDGGGWDFHDSGLDVTDDTWHHIALVWSGNDFNIYMDGVQGATLDTTAITFYQAAVTELLRVGTGTNGWVDNVRITKGVARYTAAFTPPVREFPITAPEA